MLSCDTKLYPDLLCQGNPCSPACMGRVQALVAETHLVTMLHLEMRNDMESRGRDLLRCRHVFRLL